MPRPAGKSTRRSRPSYLAAPPLLAESEPFEGAAILGEHPGALGALLWKSLRDVCAWTDSAPADRAVLFHAGAARDRADEIAAAGAEAELWAPLLVIGAVLENPAEVDYARLVHACRAVARWGERRGFAAVQLAYTQAAARLAPEHARLAYSVGRLARDRGEYARGESWLRRAVRLARGRDWHTYALAYLSLGTLYQQLGNLPAARTLTQRGYRAAVRRRVRPLQGLGLHQMFYITAEMRELGRAQEYALAAFRAYGPAHPRFVALVHDVGIFWMQHGRFAEAADVVQLVLPRIDVPEERLMALGTLAWAAARSGRPAVYQRAAAEALDLLALDVTGPERTAQGWLTLARAAAAAGEGARARTAAGHALQLARGLRLGQIVFDAEAVLRELDHAPPPAPALGDRERAGGWAADADPVAGAILDLVRSAA